MSNINSNLRFHLQLHCTIVSGACNFPCIKVMVFYIFLKVVATTICIWFFVNFTLELNHTQEPFIYFSLLQHVAWFRHVVGLRYQNLVRYLGCY
jgi:hypothetical protein